MDYRRDPGSVRETQDKRHSGAHFLWFVSLLRNKETNLACCAAANGKIKLEYVQEIKERGPLQQ